MSDKYDKFYEKIVECIKKPSNERLTEEIEEIYPWFIAKVKFFSNLKPEIVKDIIKNCEFAERETDEIIIRQFEQGDCFYVVLSGQVSIYVNTESVHDDQETIHQQDDSTVGSKHTMERKVINREKYGNYIANLGNGTSFGELALINKDCIRNATIIADCTTHLVVVNRMTYNRSLKEVHEADFKKRIDFVNKCAIFNGWIQSLKKQAAMSLVQTDFQFEADLIRQGEPLNGLLFILTGQAQIFVDVLKHPKQYPSLKIATDPSNLQPTDDHKLIHTESPNYPIRRMGYVINEHRNALRRIELSLVGPGTILGEFEYGFDLKTYMQTAICTESITAYVLSSRNFDRLIQSRRNPDGLKKIKMMAERNLMLRIKRPIDSKIPLFICLAQDIMERNLLLQEEQRDKVLFNKSKINQQQRPNDKTKSQLKQFGVGR